MVGKMRQDTNNLGAPWASQIKEHPLRDPGECSVGGPFEPLDFLRIWRFPIDGIPYVVRGWRDKVRVGGYDRILSHMPAVTGAVAFSSTDGGFS
eukprot:jgi/Botrbrau1/11606/Bobra.247_1s0020.1